MRNDREAKSLAEVQELIQSKRPIIVYISRENCGVCHAVLPQVKELLEGFPEIELIKVDADLFPEVAGEFQVFTVPALLFFREAKEQFRKARFVVMTELAYQLERNLDRKGREDNEEVFSGKNV